MDLRRASRRGRVRCRLCDRRSLRRSRRRDRTAAAAAPRSMRRPPSVDAAKRRIAVIGRDDDVALASERLGEEDRLGPAAAKPVREHHERERVATRERLAGVRDLSGESDHVRMGSWRSARRIPHRDRDRPDAHDAVAHAKRRGTTNRRQLATIALRGPAGRWRKPSRRLSQRCRRRGGREYSSWKAGTNHRVL